MWTLHLPRCIAPFTRFGNCETQRNRNARPLSVGLPGTLSSIWFFLCRKHKQFRSIEPAISPTTLPATSVMGFIMGFSRAWNDRHSGKEVYESVLNFPRSLCSGSTQTAVGEASPTRSTTSQRRWALNEIEQFWVCVCFFESCWADYLRTWAVGLRWRLIRCSESFCTGRGHFASPATGRRQW